MSKSNTPTVVSPVVVNRRGRVAGAPPVVKMVFVTANEFADADLLATAVTTQGLSANKHTVKFYVEDSDGIASIHYGVMQNGTFTPSDTNTSTDNNNNNSTQTNNSNPVLYPLLSTPTSPIYSNLLLFLFLSGGW